MKIYVIFLLRFNEMQLVGSSSETNAHREPRLVYDLRRLNDLNCYSAASTGKILVGILS